MRVVSIPRGASPPAPPAKPAEPSPSIASLRSAIACAIALVLPSVARGEGTGVVALSVSSTDRGAVADAMTGAIAQGHAARVVGDAVGQARAALAAGAVPIGELARFRRVREMIDEGWRAYLRVSFDFAQSRLAAARTEAEGLVALPGGGELYADASLRLGIVLGQLGRAAESQSAIALALALDPDRPITNLEFSPEVVTAVDAVRALARPQREVAIATSPAGAQVAVDGKELGIAPLRAQLALGQHVIVARAPGYAARAEAVAITEATDRTLQPGPVGSVTRGDVQIELEPDVAAQALAEGARPGLADARAQELVDALLQLADLDDVVLVAASDRRGGDALLVQRCAGAPARCTAVVELGYGDRSGLTAAARAAWQAVRAADLRYPPSVLADPRLAGERVVHHCELCRNPYVWAGVGAAAVIATVTTIAILSSSRPPPTVTVDPGSFVH